MFYRLKRQIRREKQHIWHAVGQLFPELARVFKNITGETAKAILSTQAAAVEIRKISEEEFGLRAGGPITLPFDSVFLEYLIKFIERRMDGDTEKALLMSISSARCSMQPQEQQSGYTQLLLVF